MAILEDRETFGGEHSLSENYKPQRCQKPYDGRLSARSYVAGSDPKMTQEDYYLCQVAAMLTTEQDAPQVIEGWDFPSELEIRYIDKQAVIAQLSWGAYGDDFEWSNAACMKFNQHHVIDFALWYEGQLCGLCMAFARPGDNEIAIEALQGNPAGNRLKGYILPIVKYLLSAYGVLLEIDEIVVKQPLEGSHNVYLQNGFTWADKGFAYAISEGIE